MTHNSTTTDAESMDEEQTHGIVNRARAKNGLMTVLSFARKAGQKNEALALNIGDIISNLGHLARVQGLDFDTILDRAQRYYNEEVTDEMQAELEPAGVVLALLDRLLVNNITGLQIRIFDEHGSDSKRLAVGLYDDAGELHFGSHINHAEEAALFDILPASTTADIRFDEDNGWNVTWRGTAYDDGSQFGAVRPTRKKVQPLTVLLAR